MKITIEVEWDAVRTMTDEPNKLFDIAQARGRNQALALCGELNIESPRARVVRMEVQD